jgi:hypothetical protein
MQLSLGNMLVLGLFVLVPALVALWLYRLPRSGNSKSSVQVWDAQNEASQHLRVGGTAYIRTRPMPIFMKSDVGDLSHLRVAGIIEKIASRTVHLRFTGDHPFAKDIVFVKIHDLSLEPMPESVESREYLS